MSLFPRNAVVAVVVVVSHIQRIGYQPEKITSHGGQSLSWSGEQAKENKRKSLVAHPPPLHAARSEKLKLKSRDASTRATQVSVGLASVQGFLRLDD